MLSNSKKLIGFVVVMAVISLACGLDLGAALPFLPTQTNTPLPANTATPTATLPPKPESASEEFEVEVQENETTVFTDKVLGYSMVFPAEWLVIPMGSEIQMDLFGLPEQELPQDLLDLIEASRQQAGIRVLVMDYTFLYSDEERSIANLNVIFDPDQIYLEQELQDLLDDNVEAMPTLVPDSRVTYQALQTNAQGVEYAKMIVNHPRETFGVPLRQVFMLVKLNEGILVVTGTVQEEMFTDVESSFQRIFNSLEFVE